MSTVKEKLQKEQLRHRVMDIAIAAGIDDVEGDDGDYWCHENVELYRFCMALKRIFIDQIEGQQRKNDFITIHTITSLDSLNASVEYLWAMGIRP